MEVQTVKTNVAAKRIQKKESKDPAKSRVSKIRLYQLIQELEKLNDLEL